MVKRARFEESLHPDPTPEEIRRQTEAIRGNWSAQEAARRAGIKPAPWMPPFVMALDLPDNFMEPDAA